MELDNKVIGKVRNILQKYRSQKILIAVSGGVDSMVLLDVVNKIWPTESFGVVNVDHDLRPESAKEVRFVQDYCHQQGYRFFTKKWLDKPHSDIGMEAAARKFRYDYFAKVMEEENFDTLVTAHHGNDMAENILMKLIRSGNAYEVVSLKERRPFAKGQIVRPLLNFSKKELAEYADIHDINHVQDQTNFDNITMRNRLRNNIFPKLQQENGQMLQHFRFFDQQINALIDLAKSQFLQIEQQMALNETSNQIKGLIKPVLMLNQEQQTLFWGNFFTKRQLKIRISNRQIDQIIEIIVGQDPNASIDLEDSWQFIRAYDRFVIKKVHSQKLTETEITLNQPISLNHTMTLNGRKISIVETEYDYNVSYDGIPKKITLRTRRDGDKLRLANGQHQKLSKRFINEKIPGYKRDDYLVLLFDNQIVWVEKIYNMSDYLKKGKKHYKINLVEVKE